VGLCKGIPSKSIIPVGKDGRIKSEGRSRSDLPMGGGHRTLKRSLVWGPRMLRERGGRTLRENGEGQLRGGAEGVSEILSP